MTARRMIAHVVRSVVAVNPAVTVIGWAIVGRTILAILGRTP